MGDSPPVMGVGPVTEWVARTRAVHRTGADAEVPCGDCTACCRGSQFIHIGPDEIDALAAIPAEQLFAAPGLPEGHVLMGYDKAGRCPMLVADQCSIYGARPRTCRTYDCRVFPATGVRLGGDAEADIATRAAQWEFTHPLPADLQQHEAMQAAAAFLVAQQPALDGPTDDTQLAVLAVAIHETFMDTTADQRRPSPTVAAVAGAIDHARQR